MEGGGGGDIFVAIYAWLNSCENVDVVVVIVDETPSTLIDLTRLIQRNVVLKSPLGILLTSDLVSC